MTTILLIEDDPTIRLTTEFSLTKHGYAVSSCDDGQSGYETTLSIEPDLVLLDVMLPGMNGFEVARNLRNEGFKSPILMLTALDSDEDKIKGLDAGADDYVTKPFSPAVLMKRVEALLRRSGSGFVSDTDELWGLSVNKDAHEVKVYGEAVSLTLKEYSILIKLLGFVGRVYSREQLLDDVWGFDYDGDIRTVDSHVARLRTKLGDWGTKHLHTVYGVGYKIEE